MTPRPDFIIEPPADRDREAIVVRPDPEGEAVGILLANILFSVKFAGRALWIENLFVSKDWRERGLGRLLVEHMLDWAEENDISGIDLVIIEVFLLQQSRFITDQTVIMYLCRIEFDLNLDVLGNGEKR